MSEIIPDPVDLAHEAGGNSRKLGRERVLTDSFTAVALLALFPQLVDAVTEAWFAGYDSATPIRGL